MHVKPLQIAWFITPHGFGHASRAAAVMAALQELHLETGLHIFTQVPAWFFEESLPGAFQYYAEKTDIGLLQDSPLNLDLTGTLDALKGFLPFDETWVEQLAQKVNAAGCRLVVGDISPLAIAVAQKAKIPSVLMENFTWDWIYEGYRDAAPGFARHIGYLGRLFRQADYLIQTEPCCQKREADLRTGPISRKPRTPPGVIRRRIGIEPGRRVVLLTMGGIPAQYNGLSALNNFPGIHFIVPGVFSGTVPPSGETKENVTLIPHHSDYYHPDLIMASDAAVGKIGYSTLAEVYYAGIPFGYITRADFRESAFLAAFAAKNMPGMAFSEDQFANGAWIENMPQLLSLPASKPLENDAAAEAAKWLLRLGMDGR